MENLLSRKYITIHISGTSITNRRLKSMLIDHFGDRICFTYPKDRRKLQMFFSPDIKSADVSETLRTTDAIKICAENLTYNGCYKDLRRTIAGRL